MQSLDPRDIEYIRSDLKRRGIVYDSLHEELVDHVCSEVEELLCQGVGFKKAYEKVLLGVQPEELNRVQNLTFQSDNYTSMMIFRNHFRIMFRNLLKYKTYNSMIIGGLAIGLSCFILIALYVKHELSYDRSFSNYQSIYRVTMSSQVGGKENHIPTSFPTLGPLMKANFPDLKDFVRIINYKYSRLSPTFRYEDKIFYEDNVIFADSTFFEIFDFPFLSGNSSTALMNPNAVVITEEMAIKYTGNIDAVGKTINFNNKVDLEITGVLKSLPSNVHLKFDFLIPMARLSNSGAFYGPVLDSWGLDWFWTYMVIPDPHAVGSIEKQLNRLTKDKTPQGHQAKFFIQPLSDIHLHSDFDYGTDITSNGSMNNLFLFIFIGVLILIVSGINFVNLAIAISTKRYKEIGISKVLGAMRSQLRIQFLSESVFTSMLALLIAIPLVILLLPTFNQLLGVSLEINWFRMPLELLAAFSLVLIIGLASGLYPAFFVSSFEPQRALKGVSKSGNGGLNLRTFLVGAQLTISIFLIIGTLLAFDQMKYIKNRDLGYTTDHIVMLTIRGTSIPKYYHAFKNKAENHSSVISVSSVSEPIGREVQFMAFKVEGQPEDQFVKILNVSFDFVKTMDLKLKEGRDFDHDIVTDSTAGFIINEAAASHFGWDAPLGKTIQHAFWPDAPVGSVIGVLKNFNFEPLHTRIDPIIIFKGGPYWYLTVRVKPGNIKESLTHLENTWKEFEPTKPINYHFLDDSIEKVYERDERVSKVFLIFGIISILTVVIGLFGLVSFVTEQRLPEVGLRKVLGASVESIIQLFAMDYIRLGLIAFLISLPISYVIMQKWLQNFAYQIKMSPVHFLEGGALILLIVIFTVIGKAWIAARANPVDVLRSE